MTARAGVRELTGSLAGNGVHHGRLLHAGDVMEPTIAGPGARSTLQPTP